MLPEIPQLASEPTEIFAIFEPFYVADVSSDGYRHFGQSDVPIDHYGIRV